MLKSLCIVAAAALSLSAEAADVSYPDGFRQWQHVKSMVISKGHPLYDAVGGIHHIYGNPKAVQGYRAGRFADGSVIVFDLFEAIDKDDTVSEGQRQAVLVMAKDSKRFKGTDGWGYQVFDPKTRKGSLDAKGQADCHGCHRGQKDKEFVFSALRD